jgi:hypothetical protein
MMESALIVHADDGRSGKNLRALQACRSPKLTRLIVIRRRCELYFVTPGHSAIRRTYKDHRLRGETQAHASEGDVADINISEKWAGDAALSAHICSLSENKAAFCRPHNDGV